MITFSLSEEAVKVLVSGTYEAAFKAALSMIGLDDSFLKLMPDSLDKRSRLFADQAVKAMIREANSHE